MSVFGLDFGNATSVVAIARRGGVDVCINEVSKRTTPACVSFGEKERHIGEAGATLRGRLPKNTVVEVKQLLGKTFDHPTVATEAARHPNRIEKGDDGSVQFKVNYSYAGEDSSGQESFNASEIAAMLLTNLKSIASTENGGSVHDCVVAVPSYFTDAQRRALLDAAEIAGINVLRLVDETTAAALQYGIPKSNDYSETEPTVVVFYDLGHSSLNVCVAEFVKGKVTIKATASDILGGRDFDRVLFDYFAARFKEKTKCDVTTNPRATLRLLTAVEKTKKILSANPEAPCNVESLMDDRDFSDKISRDDFLELASSLKERLLAPVHTALAEAGVEASAVSFCELMGGSTRMPVVIKSLESVFGREPSRTLNQDECIARGAAFIAAMLSPAFRVRDFAMEEVAPYDISVAWEPTGNAAEADTDGEGKNSVAMVTRGDRIPKTSTLTFKRSADFSLRAFYSNPSQLPTGTDPEIGTFNIKGVKVTEAGEPSLVKVKLRLDINGVFQAVSANIVETYTVTEEVEVKKAKTEGGDDSAAAAAAAPMDVEASGEEKKEEEKKDDAAAAKEGEEEVTKELVTKTKTRLVPLTLAAETNSCSSAALQSAIEREGAMAAADKLVRDTADRRNAVESYVYEMRDKVSEGGSLAKFIDTATRDSFVATLGEVEDWLYDEGEDATKSVYVAKLAELTAVGDPVVRRYEESVRRPAAFKALAEVCREFRVAASSQDSKYEHITPEERAKVSKQCDDAQVWADEAQASIAAAPGHEDAKITVVQIERKAADLTAGCRPIMNRPKPKVASTVDVAAAAAAAAEKEGQKSEGGDKKKDDGDAKAEDAKAEGGEEKQMDLD